MKNLKKAFFLMMVVFLVVGFIGCKHESDEPIVPETPVNNFKGKTFLGMTGEGEDAYFASYIIFTSDKDCEVMFFDEEPMPATYTVADDVATFKGTGEYAALQLSTTKLTDGKFSITIPTTVFGKEENIVVSYAVGTLWTILYDIPDSDEDFSLKMPEEELEFAVERFGFVEADYNKDDATKTVTLTASGWAKVQAAMGGGAGGDDSGEGTSEEWTVLDPEGNEVMTFESLEAAQAYAEENGLVLDVDYTVDEETHTITLMGGGSGEEGGEVTGETWTVMYGGITVETFESLEAAGAFASNIGLEENVDYTVNNETQTITLTAAGAEKVGIGGDTDGGDSGEVYYYKHNGELIGGKSTLEDFPYEVEHYGLVEGTDYTIDHENKYINFTDSGYAKLGQ